MLIQKFQNFAHSSLNSQITQINTNIEHIYLTNKKQNPKNLFGVFAQVKIGLQKIVSQNIFYKRDILLKDPQIPKKNGLKSEK